MTLVHEAPRRIFIFATWYPSPNNPALGTFVEEQAVALSGRYSVVVIAPELGDWRDRLASALDRLLPTIRVRDELTRGVRVVRVHWAPTIPLSKAAGYFAYLRAAQRAYAHAVDRFGTPDLIHAHVVRHGGWAAVHLARDRDLPVILTEHSGPFSMHLKHPLDRRNVAWTLQRVNHILAVSPVVRDEIRGFQDTTAPIEIIGNVIDTEFFSPAPSDTKNSRTTFRILSVGGLQPVKGMHRVIEAVALLEKRSARPFDLMIIGDGPEHAALEAMALRFGIGDKVHFAGHRDRAAVRDSMRQSDAFVLASEHESFGVVIAEAMACGLAVVATNSGGAEFVIEPGTGVLVPVGDTHAIADALVGLMAKRVVVRASAARSSIVRRFGVNAFLEAIEGVYARVAAARDRSRSTNFG